MDWLSARRLIAENVRVGTDLNTPRSIWRVVLEVGEGGNAFDVKIGENDTNKITIPWSMLESCYVQLSTAEGYSGKYFRRHYEKQAEDHGCHVHVVGRIFVKAGLARAEGNRRYVSLRN
jgi:hypothetical protein